MNVTANSALIWKRMADENQQSAKLLARVAVALFILLLCVGAYAVSAHSRYESLCNTIETKSTGAEAKPARDLATAIASGFCA